MLLTGPDLVVLCLAACCISSSNAQACSDGCTTCTSPTDCTQCTYIDEWFPDGTGDCFPLCSYGCNECDSPSLCTDCVIGYDLVPINPSNAFCAYDSDVTWVSVWINNNLDVEIISILILDLTIIIKIEIIIIIIILGDPHYMIGNPSNPNDLLCYDIKGIPEQPYILYENIPLNVDITGRFSPVTAPNSNGTFLSEITMNNGVSSMVFNLQELNIDGNGYGWGQQAAIPLAHGGSVSAYPGVKLFDVKLNPVFEFQIIKVSVITETYLEINMIKGDIRLLDGLLAQVKSFQIFGPATPIPGESLGLADINDARQPFLVKQKAEGGHLCWNYEPEEGEINAIFGDMTQYEA